MIKNTCQVLFVSFIFFALFLQIGSNTALALSQSENSSPPLKNLIFTPDEIKKWEIFTKPHDVVSEISDICFHDCVKVTWGTTSNRLTLLMIRSNSSTNAEKSAQSLREIYQSFGDRFLLYENSENDTQWSGMVHYPGKKFQWVACDTQGSVLIFISYRKVINYFMAEIDGSFYTEMVQSLTSVQKQKLQAAGFAP